jgi:hypothetical protein
VAWADLGVAPPLLVQRSSDLLGDQVVAAPGDPMRLAVCDSDGIALSVDGGATWQLNATDAARQAAANTPFPLAPQLSGQRACRGVMLDGADSSTLTATFGAVRAAQDFPPPYYLVDYLTRDLGLSWQQAPSQPLTCPTDGPCVRWGAPPAQITTCAMHGFAQDVLVSDDGGANWSTPIGARGGNACVPNELAALPNGDVLLLTPLAGEVDPEGAPVRVSHDGGRTFEPVQLPPGPAAGPRQLQLLADGSLLAEVLPGQDWAWWMLAPGARQWCEIPTGVLPAGISAVSVLGALAWWHEPGASPVGVPVAGFGC